MAAPTRSNAGSDKLPYSPPRLTIHGNLQTITAAKGGNRTDGGEPKTFNVATEVASGFEWEDGTVPALPWRPLAAHAMSGIFGYWNVDRGAPLPPTRLASPGSHHPVPELAIHTLERWLDPLAGGATSCSHRGGADVLSHSSDGATCVFDGRLDNRDELFARWMVIRSCDPIAPTRSWSSPHTNGSVTRSLKHLDGDFSSRRVRLASESAPPRPGSDSASGRSVTRASETLPVRLERKSDSGVARHVTAVPDDAMLADFILSFLSS